MWNYGHPQFEYANTLTKESKTMTSTWSDEEFDRSQEEQENHVSNVAFITFDLCSHLGLPEKYGSVAKKVAVYYNNFITYVIKEEHETKNKSDAKFEECEGSKSLEESYQNMYSQWLRVCYENWSLVSKNITLIDLIQREKSKFQVQELLSTIVERDKKIREISIELERAQKALKMISLNTSQLDQILSSRKPTRDHFGLGCRGNNFNSKNIFIKGSTVVPTSSVSVAITFLLSQHMVKWLYRDLKIRGLFLHVTFTELKAIFGLGVSK